MKFQNPIFSLQTTLLSTTVVLMLYGCSEHTQNLQTINRSLSDAQRRVDYANSVAKQAPRTNTKALKQAGKEIIKQNPTVQEASKTVESTKELIESVKKLGKTTTGR